MNANSALPDSSASPSTTTTLPRRKRRRPALSCNECRRRKVKCDQKVPCTPCARSKTAVCVYDPDATPSARLFSSVSTNNSNNTSKILPKHTRNDLTLDQSRSTQAIAPAATKSRFQSISSQGSSPSFPGSSTTQHNSSAGQSVHELNDRVQQLETMVTSMISKDHGKQQGPAQDAIDPQLQPQDDKIVPPLKGSTHCKSRFFTSSHWMNTKKEFDQILALKKRSKHEGSSELNSALKKCKDLARDIKRERPKTSVTIPNVKAEMPLKSTADLLVELYFRTHESVYRVLHRPSFFREYEQYWIDPGAASDGFVVKLLLVMSIGAIFTEDENTSLRTLGLQWINSAQAWFNAPLDKSRLNLVSVETQCLLILARQTHSVGGDTLWISVGNLIRTAMSIGLHRDPSNFPNIPAFQAELRRRIWATIIELSIQASLDCGMPPMIQLTDFDTRAPGNYDDDSLSEDTFNPTPSPKQTITDTSLQITLLSSLPTRLRIFTTINSVSSTPPYESILSLSTELTSHISSHSDIYNPPLIPSTQKSLLDILTRRFLLALHLPYAINSKHEPHYYFSRKTALDTALLILSYPSSGIDGGADFGRMIHISGSCFREAFSRASITVALELINQIREDPTSSFPSCSFASPMMSTGNEGQARKGRRGLHDVMGCIVGLSRERLKRGETNVKGFLFWSMVRAQTAVMEDVLALGLRDEEEGGRRVMDAIARAAKEGAEEAYKILRAQVGGTPESGVAEGSRNGSLVGSDGGIEVDWEALMQVEGMDFDVTDSWLLDSWETI